MVNDIGMALLYCVGDEADSGDSRHRGLHHPATFLGELGRGTCGSGKRLVR